MATLSGTLNNDSLLGTDEDDEIVGLAGADVIAGGGGNDVIDGGADNDRLFGDTGVDGLQGGDGNDVLKGGDGDDRLEGGAGYDRLFGQAGNDVILGGDGNDWIQGMAGADILTGGPGSDGFFFASLSDAGDVITDYSPEEGDRLSFIGELTGAEVRMDEGSAGTTVSVRSTGAQSFTELATLQDGQQTDPPVVAQEPVADGNQQPAGNDPSAGTSAGPIDVWYGDVQTFGDPGVPQRWVNVLGNVETDGLGSLTFSLNGGPEQDLAFARNSGNFNRLADKGDFNVELDYKQLDPTAVDDVVTIQAAYNNGQMFERDVLIDYEDGQRWPTDYSIDWSQVSDLQEAVQVVDGLWSIDDNGVRPVEIGYDRVLAIGDETWDSYEVRLSVEMNDLTNPAVNGEAIWFGMQWGGHTDDPIPGAVPHAGYIPSATFMVQSRGIVLRPSEFLPRDVDGDGIIDNPRTGSGARFQEGQTYEFLVRNERVAGDNDLSDGLDRTYGIKVWRAGDPEPENFLIQQTMIDQEPFGSFYLAAHFVDVTFGDITVREVGPQPLLVSDVLQNEDSLEPLLAANSEPLDAPTVQSAGGDGSTHTSGPAVALSDLLVSGDEAAVAA